MYRSLVFASLALAAALVTPAQAGVETPVPAAAVTPARAGAESPATPATARFVAADKNGDGKLDRVEATALHERLGQHFERMDRNDDAALDREELAAARHHMASRGHHARSHRMARVAYLRGLFVGMDDDRDQALSRAEIGEKAPRLAERFETLDGDRDGKLTPAELRQGHGHGHRAQEKETAKPEAP